MPAALFPRQRKGTVMAKARARIPAEEPMTVARVERAVVFAAYVVEKYGDQYAPILDALIADLEAMRRQDTPRERARRILAAHTLDGGLKAIR